MTTYLPPLLDFLDLLLHLHFHTCVLRHFFLLSLLFVLFVSFPLPFRLLENIRTLFLKPPFALFLYRCPPPLSPPFFSSIGSVVLSCCPGTQGPGNVTIDVTQHSTHSHTLPGVIRDITHTLTQTHTHTK